MKTSRHEMLVRMVLTGTVLIGSASLLAACEDEGPLESVGEEIDEGLDEIDDEF